MSKASDLAYVKKHITYHNGEPWATLNGLKRMANILITEGDCADVQKALQILKSLDEQSNSKTATVLCANCASKNRVPQVLWMQAKLSSSLLRA